MGRTPETQPILGSSTSLYQSSRRVRDATWGVIYILSLILSLIGGIYAAVHRWVCYFGLSQSAASRSGVHAAIWSKQGMNSSRLPLLLSPRARAALSMRDSTAPKAAQSACNPVVCTLIRRPMMHLQAALVVLLAVQSASPMLQQLQRQ